MKNFSKKSIAMLVGIVMLISTLVVAIPTQAETVPFEWHEYDDVDPITDYAYSFAVVGDTQSILYYNKDKFHGIYDYILKRVEPNNIQYVFGLGDMCEYGNQSEWELVYEQMHRMDGVVPYSFVRGNHDPVTGYNTYFPLSDYTGVIGGSYDDTMLNTWRLLDVGNVKYLLITLDYGPSDDVMEWAGNIIQQYPNRNVIISTHAYLALDGTPLSESHGVSACYPTVDGGLNNGDDMWDKLIKKYENISLVLCGHSARNEWDPIVVTKQEGDHGNTVTSMLIDPQALDRNILSSVGMVAMLYFSKDGKDVSVQYYSTVLGKYFAPANKEISVTLDLVNDDTTVSDTPIGTGTVTVEGSSVNAGEEASAVINLTSEGGFAAAAMEVEVPTNLKIKSITATAVAPTDAITLIHDSYNGNNEEDFSVAKGNGKISLMIDSAEGNVLYKDVDIKITFEAVDTDVTAAVTVSKILAAGYNTDNNTTTEGEITFNQGASADMVILPHTCKFANAEFSAVDGNCVTTYTCECGETKVFTVANTDIVFSPILEADLSVGASIANDAIAGYTNVYAGFFKEAFAADDSDAEQFITSYATIDGGIEFTYAGIFAKQMRNNVDARIYATNEEGYVVLLAQEDWSMYTYINGMYDMLKDFIPYKDVAGYQAYANLGILMVDLANYGAKAQQTFGYNVENPANDYVDTTLGTALEDLSGVIGEESGVKITCSPLLENKIEVELSVKVDDLLGAASYLDIYGGKVEIAYSDPITGEPTTRVITMDNYGDENYFYDEESGTITAVFSDYVAKTLCDDITIRIIKGDGTVIASRVFGIAQYAAAAKAAAEQFRGYAAAYPDYADTYLTAAETYEATYEMAQQIYAYGKGAAAAFAS